MARRSSIWIVAMLPVALAAAAACSDFETHEEVSSASLPLTAGALPPSISVLPVFLVPSGQPTPTTADRDRLRDHLAWSQTRYREMLHNRDTFQITTYPVILSDTRNASFWATDDAGVYFQKLLGSYGYNRFSNPYIYVVVAVGVAGGTWGVSMNGGINTGGGMVALRQSAWTSANLQSTLQHELGHSFGLSHSWTSGYLYDASCSAAPPAGCPQSPLSCRFSELKGWTIMSYNPCHHTNGMTASATPGTLLPEDINNLALNRRVFQNLHFDPEVDLPSGVAGVYRLLAHQGMTPISGQASADLAVTTTSGEAYGSKVGNIARNATRKSNPTVGYDSLTMWHSGPTNSLGWVSLDVQFPIPVTLTGLGVHTQHSGAYHAADIAQVQANGALVTQQSVAVDDTMSFAATTSQNWHLSFHSTSGYVLVRGLEFLTADGSIFPNKYPTEAVNYPAVSTAFGATYGSKVANVVTGWDTPANNSATGFLPTKMWHSGPTNASGWASLEVNFPYPVSLNGVDVRSQHSGLYHLASQVQVEYFNGSSFVYLNRTSTAADATVSFNSTKARRFRVAFYSTSGYVVIRKLQFRSPLANGYPERPDAIIGTQLPPLN